jgi:small subunit ribosomal protein S20
MPHTASAEKRLRKSEKQRRQNRAAAKKLKVARKELDAVVKTGDAAKSAEQFKATQATLDRAATKGYIHPNKAARLKSRAVKRMRAAAAKPATTTEKK